MAQLKTTHINGNIFFSAPESSIYGINPNSQKPLVGFTPQSGSGNTVIGWGNYEEGVGNTNIYAGDNVSLISKKDILFTTGGKYRGRYNGDTRLLATTASLMNANQTVNLTEKVSEQLFGIVLCFEIWYQNKEGGQLTYHFVPKTAVAQEPRVYAFPMTTSKYWLAGTKLLRITDTQIIGHNENITSTDKYSTGFGTINQNNFILRKVFGV